MKPLGAYSWWFTNAEGKTFCAEHGPVNPVHGADGNLIGHVCLLCREVFTGGLIIRPAIEVLQRSAST